MKMTVALVAVLVVAAFAFPVLAQSPATPSAGHDHQAPSGSGSAPSQAPAASGSAPSTAPSTPGAGHGSGMSMDMCRAMMAGHAGQGGMMGQGGGRMGQSGMMRHGGGMMEHGDMMGMSGTQPMEPRMLEMRGEMMKAMGEIMLKHARKMRDATPAKPR